MSNTTARGGRSTGLLNAQTFDLLLLRLESMEARTHERFDKIEQCFSSHTADDKKAHETLAQHTTYWHFTKVFLTTLVPGGGLAAFIAWYYK